MENDAMEKFMRLLANDILGATGSGRRLVAVDGIDGSGKTCFVANLVNEIRDPRSTRDPDPRRRLPEPLTRQICQRACLPGRLLGRHLQLPSPERPVTRA